MKLNIVIPVLNEETTLRNGVEKTAKFLDNTEINGNYMITIADNGSTDQTENIAKDLCKEYEQVQYFKVSRRGVGLAFRETIKRNTCDIVGYMDVDLATDIKHLREVYQIFKKSETEVVVGSRLLPGAKVYNRTLLREITSRGLNFILKLLLKVHFSDAMCGFKFYKDEIAKHLVQVCSENDGWFYCAEMMIRSEWEGVFITEIPVQWHDDANSKVKVGRLSASYMSEIIKLYKIKGERKY